MKQLFDTYRGNAFIATRMYSDSYHGITESWWLRTNAHTLSANDIRHIIHDVIGCTDAIPKTEWESNRIYKDMPFYDIKFVGEIPPLNGHYEILIRQNANG